MREWMTALLDLSAAASLAVLTVLLLRLFLRPLSKKYFYFLWTAVFVRAVCPFSYTSPFSVFALFSFFQTEGNQLKVELAPYQLSRLSAAADVLSGSEGTGAEALSEAAMAVGNGTGLGTVTSRAGPLLTALAGVWAAGVILLLLSGLISWLRLRRRLAQAVKTQDGVWETDQIATAFVLGFFRPRICIPAGLSGEKREFVLRHERIHIRRHDHQLKLLAWLAVIFQWFNPFLWLAFRLFERDMEMSCDESVLDEMGPERKESYGEFLLSLAAPCGFLSGSGPAFAEKPVSSRIRNILRYKKKKKGMAAVVLVLVLGGIWLCLSNPSGREAVSAIGGADGPTGIFIRSEEETQELSEDAGLTEFVRKWAQAAGTRDAQYVYGTLSPKLQARADELGIERTAGTEEGDGALTMGWSSPFFAETPVIKLSQGDEIRAEITYPALTSDPLWWVWKDYIVLEPEEDSWQVTEWERKDFFAVSSFEEFSEAYEDWMPDYLDECPLQCVPARQMVLRDAAGDDTYEKEGYGDPVTALEHLLHLEGGEAETRLLQEGEATVLYRFPDGEIEARMIQPGLEEGSEIWTVSEVSF